MMLPPFGVKSESLDDYGPSVGAYRFIRQNGWPFMVVITSCIGEFQSDITSVLRRNFRHDQLEAIIRHEETVFQNSVRERLTKWGLDAPCVLETVPRFRLQVEPIDPFSQRTQRVNINLPHEFREVIGDYGSVAWTMIKEAQERRDKVNKELEAARKLEEQRKMFEDAERRRRESELFIKNAGASLPGRYKLHEEDYNGMVSWKK